MEKISQKIEHTNIKKSAKAKDIKKLCQEAKDFNFRSVCINPEWVKLASQELKGTKIKIVVLVDPPMGLSSSVKRLSICKKIKKEGGHEIDIVMNIIDLKYKKYENVLKDLKAICSILPTKVIIGSGYLTDEEITIASKIVKKAGAFCVKTATESDPLENREMEEKAHHLKLMRKAAPGLLIKASGNVKTYDDVKKMIKAGADIIGTSSGIKIIKDAR
ncbi:MAG: deoxyribose-phosphate aldolase [Candidatus Pacebacteria bacterium]|nr:deoxyribose-phosphate aldolase [Candidatus Paceibacterota bacterium]